jgi:adenylate kinase
MSAQPLAMVFLGAPGAGKGTYCKEITAHYGCPQVSTGDMFRLAVKEGTPVGAKAKSFMDQGALVPDDVVLDVVRNRIRHPDCREQGIIFDGFPRTLSQADALPGLLGAIGLKLDVVVNLVVERDVLVKRLTGRRMCRSCTRGNFNTYTLPPKKEGVCDYCGGELYQRDDDKLAVIENRLKVYDLQTQPLIEYYRTRGMLHDLPVSGDIKGMAATILGLIDKSLKARQGN